MKKYCSILFIFLFISITTGVSIYSHYCNKELIAHSLYVNFDEDKCCNEMESSSHCCTDESVFAKFNNLFFTKYIIVFYTHVIGAILPIITIHIQTQNQSWICDVLQYPPPNAKLCNSFRLAFIQSYLI